MDGQSPVISAAQLQELFNSGRDDVRILDVSWYSNKDAYPQYVERHIPGALHFNIMHGVTHTDMFPRNLPDQQTFEDYVNSFGINPDTYVVVYDTNLQGQNGYFTGGRAWWMFRLHGHRRVSVLDGGLQKWEKDGYATTGDVPTTPERGAFKVVHQPSLRKTIDDMRTGQFQVCDSRAEAKYKGTPGDVQTGHVSGAISLPTTAIMAADTATLKTPQQLTDVFKSADVDLQKPIATMCNSGMSSCSLALALTVAGAADIGVFHGGFTEWKAKGERIEQS